MTTDEQSLDAFIVRVEAALRRILPEGDPFGFTEQQIGIYNASVDWAECAHRDDWGPQHPATLGCLLALVREAYGDPLLHVAYRGGSWVVWLADGTMADKSPGRSSLWPTEAEALVAALEASP